VLAPRRMLPSPRGDADGTAWTFYASVGLWTRPDKLITRLCCVARRHRGSIGIYGYMAGLDTGCFINIAGSVWARGRVLHGAHIKGTSLLTRPSCAEAGLRLSRIERCQT